MKYVSYDRLREIITSCIAKKVYPGIWVLDECKELLTQQWQTIEEFKANPVEGLCFIMYCNCRLHSVYRSGKFENNGMFYSARDITHVMPIKTPEAPK